MKFRCPVTLPGAVLAVFLGSPAAFAQVEVHVSASPPPPAPPPPVPSPLVWSAPVATEPAPQPPLDASVQVSPGRASVLARDTPAVVSLSAPAPLVPPLAAAPPAWVARDGYPLAGRVGEQFYLRDANDDFRIYFSGRANIDAYLPFGPGVSSSGPGTGLEPTFFLRRARPELGGEFLRHWQWMIGGDWGRTAVSNGNGQTATETCTIKTSVQTCTLRSAQVEAPSYTAQPTDVFINFRAANVFNIEAGQIRIPFGLENRTSENYSPFMESSLPIRNLGAPQIRDIGIMAWGETDGSIVHYEAGIFDGDGPNVLNQDANFDGIGRVFAHPFARTDTPVKTLQIGMSGHYGVRSAKTVGYDYTSLTTQEGYAFWKPTYNDSNGNLIHILPSGNQVTVGGELYWPISVVDLTGEFVYADHDTREARDGYQLAYPDSERYGDMKGFSYYAQVAVWLTGDRQYVRRPGYLDPPHVDFTKPLPPTTSSIELLAKFEQLHMVYSSAARAGIANAKSPDGNINSDVLSFGVNYWVTRRVRLTVNYDLNVFPDSEPTSASVTGEAKQSSQQRAVAPAQSLAVGADDSARQGAHTLNELALRAAVAF